MKRLTISLSDELFDEIDAMPNKSQFVRRLIEQEFGLSTGDEFGSSKTVESLNAHDELIGQLQSKVDALENELKRVFEAIETTNFIVGAVDEKLDSVVSHASMGVGGYGTTGINSARQNVDQPLTTSHQIDRHSNAEVASPQTTGTPPLVPVELSISENIHNNIDNNVGISSGDNDDFLKRTMIYLPVGARMKREIIENLLGRHFGRGVTGELNALIEQGAITETADDGISYLKR
ncbi:MAG: hypothetical protein KAH86_01465 [Methanosarcinales archaeon]|nr:hypothetical protein [Methanosarcinales archaeon]